MGSGNSLVEFRPMRHRGGYRWEGSLMVPVDPKAPLVDGARLPDDAYLAFANTLRVVDQRHRLQDDPEELIADIHGQFLPLANMYGPLGSEPQRETDRDWFELCSQLNEVMDAIRTSNPGSPVEITRLDRLHPIDWHPFPLIIAPPTSFKVVRYDMVIDAINASLQDAPLQAIVASDNPMTLYSRIVPRNLRAFLWTQLLDTQVGHTFAVCRRPGCNKWMPVSGDAKRVRSICSNKCKVQLYGQRRTRARQLHEQGKSPKAIATILRNELNWEPAGSRSRKPLSAEKQIRAWTKGARRGNTK